MPFCVICRADYDGSEGGACPKCGNGARREETPAKPVSGPSKPGAPEPPPAHLAVVDAPPKLPPPKASESMSDARPAKRLVSSAGPSVPVRKMANDSVPSSWMARLEAAKLGSAPAPQAAPAAPRSDGPPPLRPSQNGSTKSAPTHNKDAAPVGKPAHLLVAQLEAEDRTRSEEQAAKKAALFEEDRSAEIAKVEITVPEETKRKRLLPDWLVISLLAVAVLGAVAFFVARTRTEPAPKAEIDPVVARDAERRKQAVAALEEGHRLAGEGKPKADEAIKAYSRALELDSTMADAERGLAIAFATKNDDARAVEHYESYLKLAPTAPDASDVRAIIAKYQERKKRESAARAEPSTAEAVKKGATPKRQAR